MERGLWKHKLCHPQQTGVGIREGEGTAFLWDVEVGSSPSLSVLPLEGLVTTSVWSAVFKMHLLVRGALVDC